MTKGKRLIHGPVVRSPRRADARTACLALLASVLLANPATAQLTGPTSRPAAATLPVARVELWFAQLADTDPAVRARARTDLMGLSIADLPALAAAARAARPVGPEQAVALRDVVQHVFLAGQPYDSGGGGFLGVSAGTPDRFADPWGGRGEPQARGVQIASRKPGFAAYRFLEDGDVLLGAEVGTYVPFTTFEDLSSVVTATQPGGPLRLRVLRAGHELTVELRPDPKPVVAVQRGMRGAFDELERSRQAAFDEYWEKTFAPLLGDGLS